jgi:uncharacterized protein (DUF2267 family)
VADSWPPRSTPPTTAESFEPLFVGNYHRMNYNDLMRTVAGATGLTRRQADEAVINTLTVLAEAISPEETRDLLAQLPKSLRTRVPLNAQTISMRPIEFIARVADLGQVPLDDAERNTRAVFAVLTQAVNAGEMNDIAEELGDDFADLLGRAERLKRDRASAAEGSHTSIVRALPTFAGAVVGCVAAAVQRPIDAGLRLAGLRH